SPLKVKSRATPRRFQSIPQLLFSNGAKLASCRRKANHKLSLTLTGRGFARCETPLETARPLELEGRLGCLAGIALGGDRGPQACNFGLQKADPFLQLSHRQTVQTHADLVAHRPLARFFFHHLWSPHW